MEYILNYHECEMRKVAHIDMDGEISLFLEKNYFDGRQEIEELSWETFGYRETVSTKQLEKDGFQIVP